MKNWLCMSVLITLFSLPAYAQMSKGTTYYYQDKGTERWMKINTGTWMGESWVAISTSNLPDDWIKLERLQNESTDTYTMFKFPNKDYKMKIEFVEKGLWVSDAEGKERIFLRLYERYGVKVD
jgi:hypothetical protein